MKNKYLLILLLILISLIFTIKIKIEEKKDFCSYENKCNLVRNSEFSSIFNIKLTTYALLTLSILFILIIIYIKTEKTLIKNIINFSLFIGGLIAFSLILIQAFIIKSFCLDCLIIDLSIITGAILALIK